MSYSHIFGLEFSKAHVTFKISTLKFVKLQNITKKTKMHKFGTKNPLFGYFWGRILKNYCHIWNENPQISQIPKFLEKTKKRLNLGQKMPYLCIFWPELWKSIVVFEIRTLKFVKLENFVKKNNLNLGPKMPYLGFFGLCFSKTIAIFYISTLNFVKL